MTEYRTDVITGRTVIVVPSRSARPNEHAGVAPTANTDSQCPFCEGHEHSTPPELAAVGRPGRRPNEAGWYVRTIPNKFPTVIATDSGLGATGPARPFEGRPGFGYHEVVIESPTHAPLLPFLPMEQVHRVLQMCRDRVRDLAHRPHVKSVTLFENTGPESGGSLWHPHSQLVATSEVSPSLREEMDGAEQYRQREKSDCSFEEAGRAEVRDGARLVFESKEFTAFTPFASAFPFEVRILPTRHSESFADASEDELRALAQRLPALLRALLNVVPSASYNFVVRCPASALGAAERYHWHLDVYPRLIRPDGFDLGSGFHVNSVAPEDAAQTLRAALAAKL
jgi:UDPglucose--hexose-1-phosphate uridylyltransferase